MTELRKRMIEDMKLNGFAKRTQEMYLYAISKYEIIKSSSSRISNAAAIGPTHRQQRQIAS